VLVASSMTILSTSGSNTSRRAEHDVELGSRGASAPAWRSLPLRPLPGLDQVADVGLELLLREALGDGAHDEAALLGLHRLDDLAQALALLVVADALG
jgi:hypothetical protein